MNNINRCLDGERNHQVRINHIQCFEADFLVGDKVVAKGFGSWVCSALRDLENQLEGYDAESIKDKAAW